LFPPRHVPRGPAFHYHGSHPRLVDYRNQSTSREYAAVTPSAAPLRRFRPGLGLGLAFLLLAGLCSSPAPVRADDKERDKQIADLEKQLADLNKKLSDLKAAPARPAARKPLSVKDLSTWRTILRALLSRDGQWFAYSTARTEGKGELVVRQTRGDKEHRVAV